MNLDSCYSESTICVSLIGSILESLLPRDNINYELLSGLGNRNKIYSNQILPDFTIMLLEFILFCNGIY